MDDREGPFTDQQALTWLLAQPGGRVETTISNLARQWHWNRTKVVRRLKRWAADGRVVRAIERSGRSVITAANGTVDRAVSNPAPIPQSNKSVATVAKAPVHLAEQDKHRLFSPASAPRSGEILRTTASLGIAALASGIAWF